MAGHAIWGFADFFAAAREQNLGAVIIGGLLGGILQPVVAKLSPRTDDPPNSQFLLSPLLGVAAAGVSIYAIANSKTSEPIHLLFFALLCGLAFPAVLSSAVDSVSRRGSVVERRVESIARRAGSDGIEETAHAADDLKTTLAQNPAATVNRASQIAIESAAEQAIGNIARTAVTDAGTAAQVVEELRDVGTIAKTSGWQSTAQAAVDALKRLNDGISDQTIKAALGQAVERLSKGL